MPRITRRMPAVFALLALGCGNLTDVFPDEDIRVEIEVSGGFAGVSYSFEVAGREGVVRGISCASGCSFQAGEVFATLSLAQLERTAEDLESAGVLQLDGVDFGTGCCDHFAYVVTYASGERASTVRGDGATLPPRLLRAVEVLRAMVDGTLPVILALESDRSAFPGDPLFINDAQVAGQTLEADITYGGGCESHEIDLVAFGGWLESSPVQVGVFLSHEDNDDPCDALPQETRRFDLAPLAEAYREAYGPGAPGQTTLILRLEDYGEPRVVRQIEYRF